MDIVYTLSQNYTGEELKYSLRSLENIPHDRVFIVGGCPRLVKNIIHIPTEQNGNKWENSLNNILTACKEDRLSNNFILMNDDFFILEPIKTPTKELNLCLGTLQNQIESVEKRKSIPFNYLSGLKATKEFLQGLDVADPLSYELHTPFVFNKKKVLKMFDLPGVKDIPCLQIRSLYGNLHLKGATETKDFKFFMNDGFLKNPGKFLSCDDMGFYIIHNFLFNKFPSKSIYEV